MLILLNIPEIIACQVFKAIQYFCFAKKFLVNRIILFPHDYDYTYD